MRDSNLIFNNKLVIGLFKLIILFLPKKLLDNLHIFFGQNPCDTPTGPINGNLQKKKLDPI